jgi:3-methyladenine DNA glycosylase/8-oxoguanine DNA glycosylase
VPSAPAHGFVCGPTLDPPDHLDLHATLRLLQTGSADPTASFHHRGVVGAWRALRTPEGPATLQIRRAGDRLESRAWGPGAVRALDSVPDLLGLSDEASGFRPGPGVVRDLQRRHRGLRLGRTGAVLEALVPTVLEQKVTSIEAHRSWRRLVRRYGEPAPGPTTLLVAPHPERLAGIGYADLHPLGIERRRAEIIIAACRRAGHLDALAAVPAAEARRVLRTLKGIGPWSAAVITLRSHGDPDAVIVGDYNLPHLVSYALAGERRGDDARMLELLEPYRGHRARVQVLLKRSGLHPPRRAPRARLREFRRT